VIAAWRPRTSSFRQALMMWKFTVRSDSPRMIPISQLVLPSDAHCRQVISLSVSGFMMLPGNRRTFLMY
jgi:hypothetical protein